MKTLIIYDSQYGNTKLVAEALAEALGMYARVELVWINTSTTMDLTNVGLLIVGCPTQHHHITPTLARWLKTLPAAALQNVPVAVFDTRYHVPRWLSGSAAQGIAQHLRLKGAWLIAPPESFFVINQREGPLEVGELGRAVAWARG